MDDTHRPAKQGKGRASTLVLETPTSNGGWISKGLHQVEGIGMSHVRLVGKGLDSAVP